MLSSVTILMTLAYAISKHAGPSTSTDVLAQLFGDAAGNAFHGDVEKLRAAFLKITRPESNQDLERATARSSLHASLFCLMEALGDPLSPPAGKLAQWKQCVLERLPQTLRDFDRPVGGFLSEAERLQLLQAKADCEAALEQLEIAFSPVEIQPNKMLTLAADGYAQQCSREALALIENRRGAIPQRVRDIFYRKWFGYLCNSFHYEIKHNQPISNILLNLSVAQLEQQIDERFRETNQLIRESIQSTKSLIDPFATVPPLPPTFIDRPELSEPLIESLLSSSATAGLTVIEGMGGVGKTIVASSLCHDPRVRRAFPDGILWLTIGRQSGLSPSSLIQQMAQALNQEFRVYSAAAYRSLLSERAVLVVLDDVWTLDAVEPFLIDTGRSRLLYTSRDKSLAGPLNANTYEVGVLNDAQARSFLSRRSGRGHVPMPEPYASEILAECKGLVLGLAMIGGALKGQTNREWSSICTELKKAQLKDIGVRPGGYAYQTLHASIAASVDALDAAARERYLQLAVLLEDMPAPDALLRALWGGDERDVQRLMRLFVDRSLASRDAEDNIRLHDFQLDFVRGEHPDPGALELLHLALLRSIHVVRSHPEQFTSQMTGRLLAHAAEARVAAFLKALDTNDTYPRLRPLQAALDAAGGPALRAFEGHTGPVFAVALSADGKRAVSGSDDKTLGVWDLEGSQRPRLLQGHTGYIRTVALSADGERAVSGSNDTTLRVWDLEGNQPPRILEGHTDCISAVALTGDGKCAVSGSFDRTLRVWDLEGSQPPRILEGHTDWVRAVALSADGKRVVSGSNDTTLRVWDLEGNQPPRVLESHSGRVRAVALSADGRRAVSASAGNILQVWDLEGNHAPRIVLGYTRPIYAVALTADGKRAVTGSNDNTLRVLNLNGRQPPHILEGHADYVKAVAVTADGKRAVSGSNDNTLRVWELEGNYPPHFLIDQPSAVRAVALSADGKLVAFGSHDKRLRIWDLEGTQPPRVLEGHTGPVNAVALAADGKRAVSGSSDKTLRVWNLGGTKPPRVLEGHTGYIRAVALTADGRRAVSGADDKTLRVWDLDGSQPSRLLEGHTWTVRAVAMTPDGKRAISGSDDGTLRMWDLHGNLRPRVLEGHTGCVHAVALTANGKRAVSGSEDKTVRVWDLDENQPPHTLEGHTGRVRAVAITPDGKRAISGSYDKTLRLWDLEESKCLAVFTCDAAVISCSWVGEHVAAGDKSGQVHIFLYEG